MSLIIFRPFLLHFGSAAKCGLEAIGELISILLSVYREKNINVMCKLLKFCISNSTYTSGNDTEIF